MDEPTPIRFLSPAAAGGGPHRRVSPTPAAVRTVGLLDNGKDRVELLLEGLAEGLRAERPGVETLGWEKPHHSVRAPEPHLAECAARCDVAVLALAA
jgi:hypothetical protein